MYDFQIIRHWVSSLHGAHGYYFQLYDSNFGCLFDDTFRWKFRVSNFRGITNTIRRLLRTSYRWHWFFVSYKSMIAKINICTHFVTFYFKMRCHFCTSFRQQYVTRPCSCTWPVLPFSATFMTTISGVSFI